MGGIRVDVMSCHDDGTEYPHGLTLVWGPDGPVRGPFEPDERAPAVAIVRRRFSFGEGLDAVLMEENSGRAGGSYREVRRPGVGPMFNGRFIWTSDARFGEAMGVGAFAQPVKLMDRWETPAEYATYD